MSYLCVLDMQSDDRALQEESSEPVAVLNDGLPFFGEFKAFTVQGMLSESGVDCESVEIRDHPPQ